MTMILRATVLLVFLPRIHEDGAQTLSVTVKSIASETSEQIHRRVSAIRNSALRKHIRRQMKKEALEEGDKSE